MGKGGLGTVIGAVGGGLVGGPMGAMVGASIGGAVGGSMDAAEASKQASKAAGSQASAMVYQAQTALQASQISADAARYTADQTLAGTRAQVDASIRASQNSAIGGVLGAALGAHTTSETIKQWLPHEAGAATVQSWDLAQKWNTTLAMRTAGYQDAAIEYELNGKKGTSLFNDAQWNTLRMVEQTKQDMLTSVQMFGIKSDKNPFGVDIPIDEWERLHSFKDSKSLLQADPAVAAKRNAEFDAWEKKMRAEGKGIVVDMYKNPQLAGSNMLTMKGKDPMLDPSLAPLMQAMGPGAGNVESQRAAEIEALKKKNPEFRSLESNTPGKGYYFDAAGNPIKDKDAGLATGPITAKDQYNIAMDKYRKELESINNKYDAMAKEQATNTTNWNDAIKALTAGEKNPMTDQVKWAMENGIVDKYGMVNAGALNQFIPPSLTAPPEFSLFNPIEDDQRVKLADDYNKYAAMQVDPKLIREESLGMGIVRRTKLNQDGSIASTVLEGTMTDAMGNTHFVSMQGTKAQDWMDRQSMIAGGGPLAPVRRAAPTDDMLAGRFEPGFYGNNLLATPNQGNKGAGTKSTATNGVQQSNFLSGNPASGGAPKNVDTEAKSGTPVKSGTPPKLLFGPGGLNPGVIRTAPKYSGNISSLASSLAKTGASPLASGED